MTFLFQNNRAKAQEAILSILDEHIKWDLLLTLKTTRFGFLIPELRIAKEQGYRIRLQYIALSSMEGWEFAALAYEPACFVSANRIEAVIVVKKDYFTANWKDLSQFLPSALKTGFDFYWWEEMLSFMGEIDHGPSDC